MAVTYGVKVPKYLSAPLQILWWEQDELFLIISLIYYAAIFSKLFWILVPTVPFWYIRAKRRNPKGFLGHLLYRWGLSKIEGCPTYFQKHFVE